MPVPEVEEKAGPSTERTLPVADQTTPITPTPMASQTALLASTAQPTPSTVIIGMVPSPRKEKAAFSEEKAGTEEKSKSKD